ILEAAGPLDRRRIGIGIQRHAGDAEECVVSLRKAKPAIQPTHAGAHIQPIRDATRQVRLKLGARESIQLCEDTILVLVLTRDVERRLITSAGDTRTDGSAHARLEGLNFTTLDGVVTILLGGRGADTRRLEYEGAGITIFVQHSHVIGEVHRLGELTIFAPGAELRRTGPTTTGRDLNNAIRRRRPV